ncbi:hypothetical protein Plhal304r1_c002g0005791 [Plasmopara halstedii]
MGGAFSKVAVLIISAPTLTAVKSYVPNSQTEQNHDIVPIGGTDTDMLPKRSLQGSYDQVAIPVVEEERASLANLIENAGEDAIRILVSSHMERTENNVLECLEKKIMNGEYLGSPADRDAIIKLSSYHAKKVEEGNDISTATTNIMNRYDPISFIRRDVKALHDGSSVAASKDIQFLEEAFDIYMFCVGEIENYAQELKDAIAEVAHHTKEATVALIVANLARDINSAHSAEMAESSYAHHTMQAALAQKNADVADAQTKYYSRIAALAFQNPEFAKFDHMRIIQGIQDAHTVAHQSQLTSQQTRQRLGELDLTARHFLLDTSLKFERKTDTHRFSYALRENVQNIQKAIGEAVEKANPDNPIKLLKGLTEMQTRFFFRMVNKWNEDGIKNIVNQNNEDDVPWVTLWYIVFCEFCVNNPEICSNGNPRSPLQQVIDGRLTKRQKTVV